jgi:hypothetical protein
VMKFQHWFVVGASAVLALAPILEAEHLPTKVAGVLAALVAFAGLVVKSPLSAPESK